MNKASKKKQWFPLFLNIEEKILLVVGGGNIATRRVKILSDFFTNITVVAPNISEEIKIIENVHIKEKFFEDDDLKDIDLIVIATDDAKLNEKICYKAKEKGILTNIASDKNLCDFHFPAVVHKDEITVGINGQGQNHKKVKEVREKIEKLLEE